MTSVAAAVAIGAATFLVFWIVYFVREVRRADAKLLAWNDTQWHLDLLAKPVFLVRFLNAGALGGASTWLWLLNRTLVTPALNQSLKLMEQVDQEGRVPKILCNAAARHDMTERLEDYCTDISNSETLTVVGKLINYAGAYMCLTNHCGLLTIGSKAAVQEETIEQPVFVVSLPRTGTTILHRTMAHDTQRFRNFDLCDMVCPLPQPVARWDTPGRANKANEAAALIDQVAAIYPGWKECLETMHGFRPSEADEDLGWYDTGLGHMYMDPLMKLYPVYRAKAGGVSKLESKQVAKYRYAWLSMIIKIYQQADKEQWEEKKLEIEKSSGEASPLVTSPSQSQFEGPCPTENLPWLMKDPNHSAFLPELLSEFPDAKFVFTHRNPGDIVASMAKLFVVFTSVEHVPGGPGTSALEWGKEAVLRMTQYCDGLVNFTKSQSTSSPYSIQTAAKTTTRSGREFHLLETNKGTHRVDFYFKDIVQDIPGAIQTIYKQFYPHQPPPSKEAMEAFQAYLKENEREKRGNQRRSLEDFHLSPEEVAFTEYNELFLSRFKHR